MGSTRYCKFHLFEGESEHWAVLDRRAFMPKDAKPHYVPDTQIVPRHLKLELYFDWNLEKVFGTTSYRLEVQAGDVEELSLNAVNLEISRVRLGAQQVSFENNGTVLVVPLNKCPPKGGSLNLVIDHSVTQPQAGIYFTKPDAYYPDRFQTVWTQGQDENSRYYFPCFDKPNFKQTTEVILHLPPGMFGLSNGKLLKKKQTKKESLFHYKLEIPYSTYLLSIVAGDFVDGKDRWKNVVIKWFVQKGREKEGRNAFQDTSDIIRFFSEYTGYPYPYQHYTQIAVPEFIFGGMENFTVTTQTDLTLHDDRAHLDIDSNGLVAHEAAHMWFGDLITAKSWAHAWLHESFATYFDALYTRESKGNDEFRYQLLEEAETYFGEDTKYRRPIVTNTYKEPIDLFDAHLYPGGAVRLHHLKCLVGEKKFRQALQIYLKRHEYGLVETVDFLRCLEEVTARSFDLWADQWIYRGGYPNLELGFQWDHKVKLAIVSIKQIQKADKKDEILLFDLPLKVSFHYARGWEMFAVPIKEREQKFCFKLKSKPLFVRLDPDYECPCKKVKCEVSRPMLRYQLERDPNPMGRIEAAAELAVNPSHEDVRWLSKRLMKETFWGVATRIASALGKIGGERGRDGLMKGLKHKHPKVRYGVVRALGNFLHDPEVATELRRVAQGDASYRVEAAALRALGKIKDTASREFLEKALNRPSHNNMARSAIFNALAELEDERSWDTLVKGAEYGSPSLSRVSAMQALSKLSSRHLHRKTEVLDHLNRFAQETRGTPAPVFRGKLGAIQALQNLDDLSCVSILRRLTANETDGRLKRRAEDAIATLRESAKKPREIKEIRSDLDDMMKENQTLQERLNLFEKKEKAKTSGGKKRKFK